MKKIILLVLTTFTCSNIFGQSDDALLNKAREIKEIKRKNIEAAKVEAKQREYKRLLLERQREREEEEKLAKRRQFILDSLEIQERISIRKIKFRNDSIAEVNRINALRIKHIKDSTLQSVNHILIKKYLLSKDLDNSHRLIDSTLSILPNSPQILADMDIWYSLDKIYKDSVYRIKEINFRKQYRRYYGYSGASSLSLLLPGAGDILVDGNFKASHFLVMAGYITTFAASLSAYNEMNKNYALYHAATNQVDIDKYYSNTANAANMAIGCAITAGSILLIDFIRVEIKNSINKSRLRELMFDNGIEDSKMPEKKSKVLYLIK